MKYEDIVTAGTSLRKHKSGDPLTDSELRTLIGVLRVIVPFLKSAGMEYNLTWRDLLLAQDAMKIISRNRKKGLTGEIE